MNLKTCVPTAVVLALFANPASAGAQDAARPVSGGGISVPGWTGQIDDNEMKAGQVLDNSKLAPAPNGFTVTTGPAVTYWNPANKATGEGDRAECAINGAVVAGYDKAAVVGTGKLTSTDGVYGIRFAHNTEATVTGLTVTKP
jgi:hypothetical protein